MEKEKEPIWPTYERSILSKCCCYSIGTKYSDGSIRDKQVCEKCWKECETIDIYELIRILKKMYVEGGDTFYPDAMWNEGMTSEFDSGIEPIRYIGIGLGRRTITPMFLEGRISKEDAEFICLLRNALPFILSYIS